MPLRAIPRKPVSWTDERKSNFSGQFASLNVGVRKLMKIYGLRRQFVPDWMISWKVRETFAYYWSHDNITF